MVLKIGYVKMQMHLNNLHLIITYFLALMITSKKETAIGLLVSPTQFFYVYSESRDYLFKFQ